MFMTVQSTKRPQVKECCGNGDTGRHDEEHSLEIQAWTQVEREENSEVTQRMNVTPLSTGNRLAQYG